MLNKGKTNVNYMCVYMSVCVSVCLSVCLCVYLCVGWVGGVGR